LSAIALMPHQYPIGSSEVVRLPMLTDDQMAHFPSIMSDALKFAASIRSVQS
jgi:hypothetical protein